MQRLIFNLFVLLIVLVGFLNFGFTNSSLVWKKARNGVYEPDTRCLIAHPKSGDGHQKISGAMELENSADSIFRYVRIDDEEKEHLLKKVPDHVKARISAMLFTEKVRDDGSMLISYLEWDSMRGAVYDLNSMHNAKDYERMGYWTRAVSKYENTDRPNYHNKGAGNKWK